MVSKNKSAVESRTIWASVAGFVVAIIPIVHSVVSSGVLPAIVTPYLGAVFAVLAIIGRVKAKGPITSVLPK